MIGPTDSSRSCRSIARSAALVETGVDIAALDALAAAVRGAARDAALRWLAAGRTTRNLASDIERGTARISTLVGAVKRFTYMDRALTPEAVDVADGINDTVSLLQAKTRSKSITVAVSIGSDLAPARAIGSDLNQILMHIIDNAIDASPEAGRLEVAADRIHDRIVIRVVDNGPGIPRQFAPASSTRSSPTKPVGQSVGLGLDIVRQLVRRNDGDIEVDSVPGRTEFRVALRMHAADTAAT
jgi:signal transduction histidine kinase